jgi:hypothetical protein
VKLFICWSGFRSHRIAEALSAWIPLVFGQVQPFLSSEITKGARWFDVLRCELIGSQAGLLCITPENLESPWLHFEAGALLHESNANQIYTFLYDVKPDDLRGPLAAFQSTEATAADTERLVHSIAAHMVVDRLELTDKFRQHWPKLHQQLQALSPRSLQELIPTLRQLFERKTFNESLQQCTDQRWVDRYSGARQTFKELLRHKQLVQAHARASEAALYDALTSEVDKYAMDMRAHLVTERQFEFKLGKLDMPSDIADNCERRRSRVNELVQALYGNPIFDQSREYLCVNSLKETKPSLIHPIEYSIREGQLKLSPQELERCYTSSWDFDRIVYYLVQENRNDLDVQHLIECVINELEKVHAREREDGLIPLHYAIRALERAIRKIRQGTVLSQETKSNVQRVTKKVQTYLTEKPGRDAGGHIKENLLALKAAIK